MIGLLKLSERFNFFSAIYKIRPVRSNVINRCLCQKSLDFNTNVAKDVILYKYKNDRFFKIINIFALCQFGFWTYLSLFAYTNLRDAPIENAKEDKWWRKINLGENKFRYSLTVFSFLIGWGILCVTWMYSLKSVKYLILRKGGKEVTIVTYTPAGSNRMFTLGLENLNCKTIRTVTKSQLPIKVKGHYLHYMLDMRGEFTNPTLFDHTAGLKRNW
ncbi:hypothetical protein NQ314_019779 [Rhamnusium bicolor]|uniref:Transmembrane protein 223 n=1 Tax=Rhamnusium bicolor TaxID=1586634 RepID=A0AAV8WMQ8_9CUCU|nr:hypothetical protein NQ314_019779 [Rhamnusium bicolor]